MSEKFILLADFKIMQELAVGLSMMSGQLSVDLIVLVR